jgi:putative holliday junction resolvase
LNTAEGTVLAFDFGERRIGVAVGNTFLRQATPHTSLHVKTVDERFAEVARMIKLWEPVQLVVGKPLHPDGATHEMTARAEKFARQLEGRFGLPVARVDERYTSVIAEREGAKDVDAHAAALILESYFEQR